MQNLQIGENKMKITNNTNSSIVDEFLQLCEASDKNRTLSPFKEASLAQLQKVATRRIWVQFHSNE